MLSMPAHLSLKNRDGSRELIADMRSDKYESSSLEDLQPVSKKSAHK